MTVASRLWRCLFPGPPPPQRGLHVVPFEVTPLPQRPTSRRKHSAAAGEAVSVATTSRWRAFRSETGASKAVAKFNTVRCVNRRWWLVQHARQDGLRRSYRRLAAADRKLS